MRTRVIAYVCAGAALLGGSAAALREDPSWVLVVLAVPVSLLAGWRLPRWRAGCFALGAGFLAIWTGGVTELWPVVGGLVFLAVAEDPQQRPWAGWAYGLAGSTVSLVVFPYGHAAPFFGTVLGGGAALLLRFRSLTEQLEGEAEELRGQTAWLGQRTSVARELHDVVGHHVTAMVVRAEAGQLDHDPKAALRTIGDLGRTALQELDSLVVHLRDPAAPLTVSAPPRLLDIDELLAAPLRVAGVQVTVDVQPGLALADPDVLTVYRIAQEALTNVARHARARHVWVEVSRSSDLVRVRASDDGAGPPSGVERGRGRGRGSGLLGIEERVVPRGGAVELVGRPGGGSVLDVTLPVAAQQ